MIQMQRSSSLPGPSHASPPHSSAMMQDPPGNPSPAPFNGSSRSQQSHWLHDIELETPYLPFLRPSHSASQERRFPVAPLDPLPSIDPRKPMGFNTARAPPLPLLQDVSQYINELFGDGRHEAAFTTLEELAHLVRLSKYQEQKRSQFRVRLQRSLISTALSARLVRCGELTHRTLVDNFRADDKKSFATLYNAIHDVRDSCGATQRYALLEPELDLDQLKSEVTETGSYSTFMDKIPSPSRDTLLNFLSQVRTDADFLAARVAALSHTELSALAIFHHGLEPIDSVLPFRSRSKGHAPSLNRNFAHVPSAVERLLSFQRHDPLSALIHTCFANSAGPDSAEDIRRTDIWANVCAKLITDSKSGAESFICSVLNIWVAMRGWSGQSNMEWYLMKILEDGAFLLERAEDQAGTRIHVQPRNDKDSFAADEFYDTAVRGLFELVDNPAAGGIPEGCLELGIEILRKLEPKRHASIRRFLVSKWLFSIFLFNAVIHPESFGMMSEYHITEYGRQKILKEIAMRAQRIVVDLMWKQSAAVQPEIRVHIENILECFCTTEQVKLNKKLLPVRSITSLRETVEVHPYLVISPSDLVTMVNALFPEKRPASGSMEKDIHFSGLRSAASSVSGVSGVSMPTSTASFTAVDAASIMSNSGSSVFSDTTSRDPLLEESSQRFSSTSISSMSQAPRFEDEAYKLRLALKDVSQVLGNDAILGSCHPCAEQWAVLFMDSDGQQLSTQMMHDLDGNADDEEDSCSSESEANNSCPTPDLDKDYHQLRDAILKLVQDYEIPQMDSRKPSHRAFSNKTAVLENHSKKNGLISRSNSQGLDTKSRNPYRPRNFSPVLDETPLLAHQQKHPHQRIKSNRSPHMTATSPSVLLEMLQAAERQCQSQADFLNAHLYWKTSQQLRQLTAPSLKKNGYASLLNIFSRGPRDSITCSTIAIEEYEAWHIWLRQSQERHDVATEAMMKRLRALRDKMWYVTDVRNSAAYEGARNVAVALKNMAARRTKKYLSPSGARQRNSSRSSTNNFLLKTEAQVMDILTASEDHGGPNKLSDEQSDMTVKWLSQYGIENFCKGEERIHRFCLEVDSCVNKLVGDSLIEGPVLWSSELYHRDKRNLDNGRQKGDVFVTEFGALNISATNGNSSESGRRGMRGVDMTARSSPQRDLRSMSARNGSQQSFDSSRWSMSRSSVAADIMDSQDYFGTASPVLTIDSTTTFWSPFSRIQSPATSISSFRPGTSSTANETIMLSNVDSTNIAAKQTFLAELKQTLMALFISDLGTLVFARGSETDSWFSGELGQECMGRKERHERKFKKKKQRVLEKKRSFHDLRSAHSDISSTGHVDTPEERVDHGTAKGTRSAKENIISNTQTLADGHSLNDIRCGSPPKEQTLKKTKSLEFPFKSAFRRLLKMFSVHPNPYTKLNALYELENLIIASLTLPRRKELRQDALPSKSHSPSSWENFGSADINPIKTRAHALDEAIDNCTKRRSQLIYRVDNSPTLHAGIYNHSVSTPVPASTDMIVNVLQDLFREADVRPKTLFRDLQFIAAFVPASVLDRTDHGKAFWDTGLAALSLKQDVCRTLVEIADEIVLHYTQSRQISSTTPLAATALNAESSTGEVAEVMRYSLADAARMWTITAKEGDAVAERELAIFYLTHPELVERTTRPLTRPRETFKAQVMEMHAGGGEGDRERSDPATMCVAYHWMELSALGGDELAKKYLRQREELNALP